MSARFDDEALSFARQPGIDEVSRLYSSWGAEITSIVFYGNERECLGRSLRAIVAFLRGLTMFDRDSFQRRGNV